MNGNTHIPQMLLEVTRFSRSPHGRAAAPTGIWDHIIVYLSVAVVLVCVYLCIRFFLLPKEKDRNHIKRKILRDDIPSETGNGDDR